jgi:hypothetical protein
MSREATEGNGTVGFRRGGGGREIRGSEERTGVVDVGEVGQCPYAADRGAAIRPCAWPERVKTDLADLAGLRTGVTGRPPPPLPDEVVVPESMFNDLVGLDTKEFEWYSVCKEGVASWQRTSQRGREEAARISLEDE